MIDVALDFETFYSAEYSLRKVQNAEYVLDERFEVIGFSLKLPGTEARWVSGDFKFQQEFLSKIPWDRVRVIAHNARFDGSILEWRFGFKPASYLCTMVGSRPHFVPYTGSMSLEAISNYVGLPPKGHAVHHMLGKHREDLTPAELAAYGDYCKRDTENSWSIAQELYKMLPPDELDLIDLTLKKYLRPKLKLDGQQIVARIAELRQERAALLEKIKTQYGVTQKMLASRPLFAEILKFYGVDPPTKPSLADPTQNTYAFAKHDPEFKELLVHDKLQVRELSQARMAISSSQEMTRLERLLSLHNIKNSWLPCPLIYYGAHTGRFSGDEKINLQNLQRGSAIRSAMVAPSGYQIIAADLAQIEARIAACLAGQDDLVQAFREGRDVYSEFASDIYERPITKADKEQRFVGKSCIAEGTLVLCGTGWKPIQEVTTNDLLWDGTEWVCHQGLIDNGLQDTQQISNVWLTPDHCVWSGTQWLEAQSAVLDADILCQVLDTGADCLRLLATLPVIAGGLGLSWSDVLAADLNTLFVSRTSKSSDQHDAQNAAKTQARKNGFGYTVKQCQTPSIGVDSLIAWTQPSADAITKQIVPTSIMGSVGLRSATSGEQTKSHFYTTSKQFQDGTIPVEKWIEQTTVAVTDPAISDSQRAAKMRRIKENWQSSKRRMRVYDLLSTGSRNRFVIKSDDGALIVHNCILGLGYGMGHKRFMARMHQDNIPMERPEAERIVDLYRCCYSGIVDLWGILNSLALSYMVPRGGIYPWECLVFTHQRIILPNNMPIIYPDLAVDFITSRGSLYFRSRKFQAITDPLNYENGSRLWGGTLLENVCQALARIIVTTAELKLSKLGLPASLQVHDELVFVVPEQVLPQAKKVIQQVMETAVEWMPKLPINVEIKSGPDYGSCK